MKEYTFTTSPGVTGVIDELARQSGVDTAGVVREGLIMVASKFNRQDLKKQLEPTDCVGLSGVSGDESAPEAEPETPQEPQAATGPPPQRETGDPEASGEETPKSDEEPPQDNPYRGLAL